MVNSTLDNPDMKPASFKLNGFEISLSLTDTQLVLEAEETTTSRIYKKTVLLGSAEKLTSGLFSDIQSLYQALIDGFSEADPAVKISISSNAELFYVWEVMKGKQKRVFEFTIVLEEEQIDYTQKLERQLQKLSDRVAMQEVKILELEKQNNKLLSERVAMQEAKILEQEKENNNLKSDLEKAIIERIDGMEKAIITEVKELNETSTKKLEQSLLNKTEINEKKAHDIKESVEKALLEFEKKMNLFIELRLDEKPKSLQLQESCAGQFAFDPSCAFAGSFSFSNGNKTVTYTSSDWTSIIGNSKIPKNQKTKFSVRIDHYQTYSCAMLIGICPSNLKTSKTLYSQKGVYCYYTGNNGNIYQNGAVTSLSNAAGYTNSVVTVTVDLANNNVTFELNGTSIYNGSLDSSYTSSYDYYPFVEFLHQGDKVSFI